MISKKDPLLNDKIKPKFISKEERTKIALENRAKEAQALKERQEKEKILRENFFKKAGDACPKLIKRRRSRSPSLETKKNRHNYKNEKKTAESKSKELDFIKKRYIGGNNHEKKVRKTGNKKFVFDWDKSEDTTQFQDNFNPLADKIKEINSKKPLTSFGKGRLAGFDPDLEEYTIKTAKNKKYDSEQSDEDWKFKELNKMTNRDWRIFKESFDITTKGGNIPNPIRKWEECVEISKPMLKTIYSIGYSDPTPIQKQALPISFKYRDLIGIAETGSGKTASFVIPILVGITRLPKFNVDTMLDGPYGLILVPTRELAIQIETEARKLASSLDISIISIVGGHSITDQAFSIRNGVHIVIATPGRLRDCLESHILALNQCSYVVLDEADRMVDLGFEVDLNFILDSLPSKERFKNINDMTVDDFKMPKSFRQTLMFSATMPSSVEKISLKYLNKPAIVTIGNAGQAVGSVKQMVEIIKDDNKKLARLKELLDDRKYSFPIIVFVNTKKYCDIVSKQVTKFGHRCVVLHGGKSQEQRESSLALLKNGNADILIATDVAGRGIDIKNVGLVINYDMAKTIEDYTHRIGRTGRAGAKGTSITFLNLTGDSEVLFDLRQALLKKVSPSQLPMELNHCEAALHKPGTFVNKKRSEQIVLTN